MTRAYRQAGFGVVVAVIAVLATTAVILTAGAYIMRTQQTASPRPTSINSFEECVAAGNPVMESYPEQCAAGGKTFTNPAQSASRLSLAEGKVGLYVPDGWTAVKEENFNSETAVCGHSVISEEVCIDLASIVLKSEGLTSSDQFRIRVGVFKRQSDSSVTDWFNNELDAGSEEGHVLSELNINGMDALSYSVNYGDRETRVRYAVTGRGYGVLISANAFAGDYYSFINKNNIDYRTYLPVVEQVAKSVEIQ